MNLSRQRTYSPIDGSIIAERTCAAPEQIDKAIQTAHRAFQDWKNTPPLERAQILSRGIDAFVQNKAVIAEELTRQMGRPISATPGEVMRYEERARYMIEAGPRALADLHVGEFQGFNRFIRRQPLGVVLTVAPWNYPYLTAVNSVIPALMAGNAVVLKHSAQTPLCAERIEQTLQKGGLPPGLFQVLHTTHDGIAHAIQQPHISFVSFTGSVIGGHAIQEAAVRRFISTGLELGGKDPAYVRHDADLQHSIENLVDGAFFNSGQSCCAIERIYVHEDVYRKFVEGFVDLTRQYVLGNPLDPQTTLGPMVRISAAESVRNQIAKAVHQGAQLLVDESSFPQSQRNTPYLSPHVLVEVDHSMEIMTEETFGPAIGIMKVRSDEEAVRLMNDSRYGLTAAIWTQDEEVALRIGHQVETGTWFMNRCDYLDPALAWVGIKDSGRGCTLSVLGYEHLTRPKSFHLRRVTPGEAGT